LKIKYLVSVIGIAVVALANCKTAIKPVAPAITNPVDSLARARAKDAETVRKRIAGRENAVVDSVFQNLKVLGGFPAENLVFAMERWSEALGVGCDHCHVPNEWHQDVKPEKEIARQMVEFGERVNADLRKIKGLKSEKPLVNCYSCHRGEQKPARKPK
jgi:Photosynthetic reaction centre cytochrome C subunit